MNEMLNEYLLCYSFNYVMFKCIPKYRHNPSKFSYPKSNFQT